MKIIHRKIISNDCNLYDTDSNSCINKKIIIGITIVIIITTLVIIMIIIIMHY